MALESTTYINGLVATNPTGTDPKSQGDDHIRLVKSAIKNTFTGITGEVTATHTELNKLDGYTGSATELNYAKALYDTGVTSTEFDTLDGLTATTAELNTLDGITASTTELNYCDGVTSNIQTQLNTAFQAAYPVGSIYMNASVSTNPATLLGFGTWVSFGEGRMLLGESSSYTAGATGGSKDATLVSHTHSASSNSTGSHTHTFSGTTSTVGNHQHLTSWGEATGGKYGTSGSGQFGSSGTDYDNKEFYTSSNGSHNHTYSGTTSSNGGHSHTITVNSTGSSGTDANMPPYIVVYMWKRTA